MMKENWELQNKIKELLGKNAVLSCKLKKLESSN